MDRKHEKNEKTNDIEQTPKTLTVEDLAAVVGGAIAQSENKTRISECRYVAAGGGALSDLSLLSFSL